MFKFFEHSSVISSAVPFPGIKDKTDTEHPVPYPLFFSGLLTKAEFIDQCTISLDVLLHQVVQKTTALTDKHVHTAA